MTTQEESKSLIHKNHRSRMKTSYLKSGFESFSDIEKLEFILYYAISQKDTNPLAHKLIEEFGDFNKVLEAPIEKLKNVDGLGEHSAILLNLFLNVLNHYGKSKCDSKIGSTSEAKNYARNLYNGVSVEEFYVVCLSKANKILASKKINSGTSSEVTVTMKNITSFAMNNNCERIILIHNHPNGLARPSDEDISFTASITLNCIMNDIEVLDHIISGDKGEFSFEESGMLKELKKDAVRKYGKYNNIGQESSNYKIN